MMKKSMQWPYHGAPKVLCLPPSSPFRSEGLVREMLMALTPPDERKQAVERMVAAKVTQYLTSKSRPTMRQAWLELKAWVSSEGLQIEEFLNLATFYQRVGTDLARMKRDRDRETLRLHGGPAELVSKVMRILRRHLYTQLWADRN